LVISVLCNLFRVSDRGGGIKHELLERIWQYGSTATYTTSDITAERWSDHDIFERIRSNKTATDSFHGSVSGGVNCCSDVAAVAWNALKQLHDLL